MANLNPDDKYFEPLKNQYDVFITYFQLYEIKHFLSIRLQDSYLLSAYSEYIKNSI